MADKKKRVVLIGTMGHGKTTLFNRLTGAKEMAKQGGESLTRTIALGYSKAESHEKSFEVLDTPGFGETKEKMKQIACILAALKQKEIYRIIFVIRHERIEQMKTNIKPLYKFFKNFKEYITIYISFFDQFTGNKYNEKQNIIQKNIEEDFKIKSFIYNENQSDASIINEFDLILQKSQPIKVSFSIDLIIECFDIFNLNNCESAIELYKGQLVTQFHTQINQPILKFIKNFPKQINDPLYLNYLDELSNFSKLKAEEYLQQYINKFGEEMNNQFEINSNNSQYAPYIKLQDTINIELSQINLKINEKKQAHPDFIGNKIKACPHCNKLWVRDYGCNKILCGAKAGDYNPNQKLKPLIKFEYKLEHNEVKLIQNDIQLFKDKNELINQLKHSFNNKQFEQIFEQFNIKHDYQFIELLKKELGESCFDQWIDMVDKRKYDTFVQILTELLLDSRQKPEEVNKTKNWLWKVFLLGI